MWHLLREENWKCDFLQGGEGKKHVSNVNSSCSDSIIFLSIVKLSKNLNAKDENVFVLSFLILFNRVFSWNEIEAIELEFYPELINYEVLILL